MPGAEFAITLKPRNLSASVVIVKWVMVPVDQSIGTCSSRVSTAGCPKYSGLANQLCRNVLLKLSTVYLGSVDSAAYTRIARLASAAWPEIGMNTARGSSAARVHFGSFGRVIESS